MPGKRTTPEEKRMVEELLAKGLSDRAIANRIKTISDTTVGRIRKGLIDVHGVSNVAELARSMATEMPAPRRYDQLSTDAAAALADFNLFGEMFFKLRPAHWRRDAAMTIVDAVLDHEQRDFIDMNVFPGAGKTTLAKVVICWMLAGGGSEDPAVGRGLRGMLGSETEKVAKHMLRNVRLPLELRRPFTMFDKEARDWISAEFCLAKEYGRFKPDTTQGDEKIWSQEQILVAQLEDVDLTLKEPTLQIASYQAGFLGERVDFAFWDDLATTKNSTNPEIADAMDGWCENEAETRVEKGGLFLLIGQRLSPLDLHRKRLDARVEADDGRLVPLYTHVVYPSHHDELCNGDHRQWDPVTNEGCLTDASALNVRDWIRVRSKRDYRTVYQQEDVDPAKILVQPIWLEGGTDPITNEVFPGCYDRDRGFHEWPVGVGNLVDYATLDPSAGNFWVQQWWALQPETRHNYLIEGRRARLTAGAFLDWDEPRKQFTGWMHETQLLSMKLGHPIKVWIIEAVAAHKYLFQFEHFRRWKQAFPFVSVIAHQTQMNKNDPELGVEGLLPGRYRTGMKHLPKKESVEQLNFLRSLERELTKYPFAETDDQVMADWIGEWNVDRIIQIGRRSLEDERTVDPDVRLPKYLQRQLQQTRM